MRIIANAEVPGVGKSVSADAILELGNKAHKAENYEEAFELWGQVEKDYEDTAAWGKAAFNTGVALKEQKRFDDAIRQFKKLLNITRFQINPPQAGAPVKAGPFIQFAVQVDQALRK